MKMPEGSNWLGDILATVFFLLGLTFYGLRMLPPLNPQETPKILAKWNSTGPIISIDLGTRNSRVGLVATEHRVHIIHGRDGMRAIPSTACSMHQEPFILHAGALACADSGGTLHNVRDIIRATHPVKSRQIWPQHDLSSEIEPLHSQLSAKATGMDRDPSETTPIALVAAVLSELRSMAEQLHGGPISQAVITIPADLGSDEREAVKDAALFAGLAPVQFLDESLAATIAYGLDRLLDRSHVVILDVGSAARATLLSIEGKAVQVLSTAQNQSLGGDMFNRLLFEYGSNAYKASVNDDLDSLQARVLEDQVEMAKIKLSFEDDAVIALPILRGPWFLIPLTRDTFGTIVAELVEEITIGMVNQLLSSAGVTSGAVDYMILTGGSANIPALKASIQQHFPGTMHLSAGERHPEDAVVYGAALFARRLSLGQVPEENKIHLQHATPLRFGIELAGGKFATFIARNSPLPVRNTRRLTLHGRTIRVFAGMAEFTNATEFLGSIVLPPQMPTSRLKITIDLNIFGVLNITAADDHGSTHSALMQPRLPSKLEIARMEAEAAALAEREDVKRRMQALRTYLTQFQPILRRNLSKLAQDDPQRALRAQIAEAVDVLDAWLGKRMLSASREQFVNKLSVLEGLLRQDVELRENLPAEG
ncbi:heat shock protein 70 family [Mycena latifolia]|nr:heat shock protein 70 family [Mycena latifolia]